MRIKLVLEVDGVLISQINQNTDNECFVKDLKDITNSKNIEVQKTKDLIKNIMDSKY